MPIYLYLNRATALHRLHPAVKILALFAVFWSIYWLDNPAALAPLGLMLVILAQVSGSWSNFYRLRWLLILIVFFTTLVWVLFYRQGPPLFRVGPLPISRASLEFGFGRGLKLAELIATTILFLSTTRVEEFAYGLAWLGMPHRIGFAITLAFRLAPLFIDSALDVVAAQRLRGHDFGRGGPIARMRGYAPVMVPVFMGALRKANNMAMALEARGFGHTNRPTSLAEYRLRPADWVGLAALGALATGSFLAYWLGYGAIKLTH
jgi:energy-coupling factor transport system permease protein